MREFLAQDDNDGILLIDADNAFNRVNRGVALWNVQYTCPDEICAHQRIQSVDSHLHDR